MCHSFQSLSAEVAVFCFAVEVTLYQFDCGHVWLCQSAGQAQTTGDVERLLKPGCVAHKMERDDDLAEKQM